jgi:hypothetical protein
MKTLSSLIFLLVITGCNFKNKSTETPLYTLTPIEGSKNLYLTTKEFTGVIFAPDTLIHAEEGSVEFMPSIEEIYKAEHIFKICLATDKIDNDGISLDSTEIQAPSEYIRQYVGHKNKNGEKVILLNCFTKKSVGKEDYWKKDIIVVKDGGDNYFSIQINITKEDCLSFNLNGTS